MAYTLSPKPVPRSYIDWALAPASLVGCCPLIQGEDSVTTMEYVTRQTGSPDTFTNFGSGLVTQWESFGISMVNPNSAGTPGATAGEWHDYSSGIHMPLAARITFDLHRRTIAWAHRYRGTPGGSMVLGNALGGGNRITVEAPVFDFMDPDINLNLGGTALTGTAGSLLINTWHALMVSWSDGLGSDPAVGQAMWNDGVLIASSSTISPNFTLGGEVDFVSMFSLGGAAHADFEYFYMFNEFIPSGNTLALKLFNNPYYFFGGEGPKSYGFVL